MQKCKKRIVVFVCTCFLLVSVLSIAFVISNSDHECIGEHCEICLQISHITNILKQLRTAVFSIAVFIAAIFPTMFAAHNNRTPDFVTPVSLKVKMNN